MEEGAAVLSLLSSNHMKGERAFGELIIDSDSESTPILNTGNEHGREAEAAAISVD